MSGERVELAKLHRYNAEAMKPFSQASKQQLHAAVQFFYEDLCHLLDYIRDLEAEYASLEFNWGEAEMFQPEYERQIREPLEEKLRAIRDLDYPIAEGESKEQWFRRLVMDMRSIAQKALEGHDD